MFDIVFSNQYVKQFNNRSDRHESVCQYYLKCRTKIHDLEIIDSVKELPL